MSFFNYPEFAENDALSEAGLGDLPWPMIPLNWRERLAACGDVKVLIGQLKKEWRSSGRAEAYGKPVLATLERHEGRELGEKVMDNHRVGRHRILSRRAAERCAKLKEKMLAQKSSGRKRRVA